MYSPEIETKTDVSLGGVPINEVLEDICEICKECLHNINLSILANRDNSNLDIEYYAIQFSRILNYLGE